MAVYCATRSWPVRALAADLAHRAIRTDEVHLAEAVSMTSPFATDRARYRPRQVIVGRAVNARIARLVHR